MTKLLKQCQKRSQHHVSLRFGMPLSGFMQPEATTAAFGASMCENYCFDSCQSLVLVKVVLSEDGENKGACGTISRASKCTTVSRMSVCVCVNLIAIRERVKWRRNTFPEMSNTTRSKPETTALYCCRTIQKDNTVSRELHFSSTLLLPRSIHQHPDRRRHLIPLLLISSKLQQN